MHEVLEDLAETCLTMGTTLDAIVDGFNAFVSTHQHLSMYGAIVAYRQSLIDEWALSNSNAPSIN